MIINELTNRPSLTTVPFKAGMPRTVWFDLYDDVFDTFTPSQWIVVLSTRPGVESLPTGSGIATLMESALYVGMPIRMGASSMECMCSNGLWNVPGSNAGGTIGSAGLTSGLTFGQVLSATATGLGVATVNEGAAVSGTWTNAVAAGTDKLRVLAAAATDFGVEWVQDRTGRIKYSTTATDIYPTTPDYLLVEGIGRGVESVNPPRMGCEVTGYLASRAHHISGGDGRIDDGTGVSGSGTGNGLSPRGTSWSPTRWFDLSGMDNTTTAGSFLDDEVAKVDFESGERVTFNARVPSTADFDFAGGATVAVWAPSFRIQGGGTTYDFDGALADPMLTYISGMRRPVIEGMGVYMVDTGADTWQDLTDWVQLAPDGPAELTLVNDYNLFYPTSRSGISEPDQPLGEERPERLGQPLVGPLVGGRIGDAGRDGGSFGIGEDASPNPYARPNQAPQIDTPWRL